MLLLGLLDQLTIQSLVPSACYLVHNQSIVRDRGAHNTIGNSVSVYKADDRVVAVSKDGLVAKRHERRKAYRQKAGAEQ